MAAAAYRRARGGGPTRVLCVANVGPRAGVDAEAVRRVCGAFGPVEAVAVDAAWPHAFVCFASEAAAAAAREALDGHAFGDCGRVVRVGFAEPAPPLDALPPPPPGLAEHDLAASAAVSVAGLRVLEGFVSEAEEAALLAEVDARPWAEGALRRRVQHYGFAFDYATRRVEEARRPAPLPAFAQALAARLARVLDDEGAPRGAESPPFEADQVTVNEYLPQQGIGAHIDTHSAFVGPVVSLSLGSDVVMQLRRPDRSARKSVLLRRRSLLVLSGEARYAWEHGIATRSVDLVDGRLVRRARRVSLTLRRVRDERVHGPCRCAWPALCDQQAGSLKPTALQEREAKGEAAAAQDAPRLEREFVHAFYERVAAQFEATRRKPWPRVEAWVRALPRGALVADVGCGSGRYLFLNRDALFTGVDFSEALCRACAARGAAVVAGDAVRLPLASARFDAALLVAVLHHLSTPARRLAAVSELARVLRQGGEALLTAWALEQRDGARQFAAQDVLVDWQLPKPDAGAAVKRFCHLFRAGELEALVAEVASLELREAYYDEGNWCAVVRRRRAGAEASS
jgi:alkylated DNA repair protein alkB family protein 8